MTAPEEQYRAEMRQAWMEADLSDAERRAAEERAAIERVDALFRQKLAAEEPDHPWLKRIITECALCYHFGSCVDDGEAYICADRAACEARQK